MLIEDVLSSNHFAMVRSAYDFCSGVVEAHALADIIEREGLEDFDFDDYVDESSDDYDEFDWVPADGNYGKHNCNVHCASRAHGSLLKHGLRLGSAVQH